MRRTSHLHDSQQLDMGITVKRGKKEIHGALDFLNEKKKIKN
jgi:hypothetical protein